MKGPLTAAETPPLEFLVGGLQGWPPSQPLKPVRRLATRQEQPDCSIQGYALQEFTAAAVTSPLGVGAGLVSQSVSVVLQGEPAPSNARSKCQRAQQAHHLLLGLP